MIPQNPRVFLTAGGLISGFSTVSQDSGKLTTHNKLFLCLANEVADIIAPPRAALLHPIH